MKILHTSDWHIGRALYGKKRYAEHEAFLDWLAGLIEEEGIDVLIVAGDIFDNATPSNRAQQLYYRFLCRVAGSANRHVVVTAGNHDSPSFLNAPRELLKSMNVHVVGRASDDPGDEIVAIPGPDGAPRLIVCAVPYLRDREIRTAEAGEGTEEKDKKIIEGIRAHYRNVCDAAETILDGLASHVPMVATGHLFAAGGQTVDGDGVRRLYIGTLAQVGADVFPASIDYLALGHLHVPQTVGGSELIRYSGSPIPMGFGEAGQEKSVVRVSFAGKVPAVEKIPVPRFQALKTLRGDWAAISSGIEGLKADDRSVWVEVVYDGKEVLANLRERLEEAVDGSAVEILRAANTRVLERAMGAAASEESLDDMDPAEVFESCLDAFEVPEDQREPLLSAYREVIVSLNEDDPLAQ
jgi:DNA repair protein SbcD/Mre11